MPHAPGPWFMGATGGQYVVLMNDISCDSENMLARVCLSPEAEANCKLLAAAPDLLAACEAALTDLNNEFHLDATYDLLCAAVAKAKGVWQ